MDVRVETVPQHAQLGRQLVHDPRSREFPARASINRSGWRTVSIRLYDPRANPNQCHGECTGCAKSMEFNAVGNRIPGEILTMKNAHSIYSKATTIDPIPGEWPPSDTGSSGLAAAKAAQSLGLGGEYRHVFSGADEVVQLLQSKRVVNIGTWWYDGMFEQNSKGVIEPTGPQVGGHQYIARGYNLTTDMIMIRCWWGPFRDAWIKREHLNELLHDGGDAHVQDRIS